MPDNMKIEIIRSSVLGEQYFKLKHKSGVTMLLCPMEGFSTAYALFGTNYGSMDVEFKTPEDPDFVEVPAGIAHYLEHKLFENEEGDAFQRFAATGANANAYTSFDKTCYLFSCTQNFEQSLEILLDFVTRPYFTEETVQKEQGIIGQEIRMYDDNPEWQVYFNLLKAMYQKNPVRVDIAGTVESIAQIDKDLLYRCYSHFYNLNNMAIAIAGNFSVESAIEVADRVLWKAEPFLTQRRVPDEPEEVCQRKLEMELEVAAPIFQMGFKLRGGSTEENMRNQILDEVLVEIIAGETTSFYRELYDEGLINATFGGEAMAVRSLLSVTFGGESREPEKVYEAILERVRELKRDGVDDRLFRQCKKTIYGRYIGIFSRPEAVASTLLLSHFTGVELYSMVEELGKVTREKLEQRLRTEYREEWSSLSIVRGRGGGDSEDGI